MKKIVVSGINLIEGGPLTIFFEVLNYLSEIKGYKIVALVHKKELFQNINNKERIKFLEFEDAKKSYLKRCYYEYYFFKKLSKELKADLWLSLHDISPNVEAIKKAVYCHNPLPFYKMNIKEILLSPNLYLVNLFYGLFYKINIKKNDYVVVQQKWIGEEFKKKYGVDSDKIVIAHPEVEYVKLEEYKDVKNEEEKIFFYPAFPRVFKNFEVICEAAKKLEEKGYKNLKFVLTLDDKMNRYSKYIYKKYKNIKSIKFVGRTTREETFEYYKKSTVLLFPSKLETWGLPITEYKFYEKPIFLADLPYAHETLGDYDKACFFNPFLPEDLVNKIEFFIKDEKVLEKSIEKNKDYKTGWKELFDELLKEVVH